MSKIVKFYYSDLKTIEFESPSDFEVFRLNIKREPRAFATIFKGYADYPEKMFLKDYYETNLANKEIIKIEFYSDDFLLDTFTSSEDHCIKISWETGVLQNGNEVVQERLNISEYYINF